MNHSPRGTLRRFWFPLSQGFGVGVTAFSETQARDAAEAVRAEFFPGAVFDDSVPDVDVRTLDQNHVVPNMGVVTVPGVWYPRRNG